jgi:hypothetical protein
MKISKEMNEKEIIIIKKVIAMIEEAQRLPEWDLIDDVKNMLQVLVNLNE